MKDLEFEKALLSYSTATGEQRVELDKDIDKRWDELTKRYRDLCNNDPDFVETLITVRNIHHVMDFTVYDAYSDYTHPENYENIDDAPYEFQEERYKKHQFISTHYDELVEDLTAKLDRLKTSILVFDRETKIKKVEDELKYYKEAKEQYDKCQEMLKKQEEYKKNKATLVDPVEQKYKEILIKHAKVSIEEYLEKYPQLICKSRMPTWGTINVTQGKVLSGLFNELKSEITQRINAKTTKNPKKQ